MSRCFPYPPPGYTLSRADEEALIESIKLQKEREKAKDKEQRKKDKKSEKKEKKKEKKEKRKEEKDKAHQNLYKSDVLAHNGEKLRTNTKSKLLHVRHEAESEQVERSSLTEEHGHAICLNAPSNSSDSTENSNKRKRQCLPENVNRVHGKIIRIRLSKRPDDSSASTNEQQACSTSGRAQFPSQHKNDIGLTPRRENQCGTVNEPVKISQGIAYRIGGEQVPSTSQQIMTAATRKTEDPPVKNTAVTTPMQKMELQYKNLFENWALPQLQDASLPDDLDWLYQGKNKDVSTKKTQISGNARPFCSGSQTLWPRAQHLHEVDVYMLPFTVPF